MTTLTRGRSQTLRHSELLGAGDRDGEDRGVRLHGKQRRTAFGPRHAARTRARTLGKQADDVVGGEELQHRADRIALAPSTAVERYRAEVLGEEAYQGLPHELDLRQVMRLAAQRGGHEPGIGEVQVVRNDDERPAGRDVLLTDHRAACQHAENEVREDYKEGVVESLVESSHGPAAMRPSAMRAISSTTSSTPCRVVSMRRASGAAVSGERSRPLSRPSRRIRSASTRS